jgi:hypothetical protein
LFPSVISINSAAFPVNALIKVRLNPIMGLWDFIKGLFRVALAYLLSWLTGGYQPEDAQRAYRRNTDHLGVRGASPSRGSRPSPRYIPPHSGVQSMDSPPDKYPVYPGSSYPGYSHSPQSSAYASRGYPERSINMYGRRPSYRGKEEDLYDDKIIIYERGKFRFAPRRPSYAEVGLYE